MQKMTKITIKRDGEEEQVFNVHNFILSVDADSDPESLVKMTMSTTFNPAHLIGLVLTTVGGAANNLGVDLDKMMDLVKDAHRICSGSIISNKPSKGGGSDELH